MELQFKKWLEDTGFGKALTEPIPASEAPLKLNKNAFPTYDLEPLPGNKKPMKKMSKKG